MRTQLPTWNPTQRRDGHGRRRTRARRQALARRHRHRGDPPRGWVHGRRGRGRHRRLLRPAVRQRLGLRHRRRARPRRHGLELRGGRRARGAAGVVGGSGSTPPSTPTATSTTSSAWACGKRSPAREGWPAPVVVAHDAVPARFDRYIVTAGYNEIINQRQFGVPGLRWPTEYRYPDRTYAQRLELDVGGVGLELHHARGETDDHTWTWVPGARVLCCGDLFIWASPNAGNPQKVQRYPREWAVALREMIRLEPEVLLPGHGFPVVGADAGPPGAHRHRRSPRLPGRPDPGAHERRGPARRGPPHRERCPPTSPNVRTSGPSTTSPSSWCATCGACTAGWWDGNPASLKPAPESALAGELAALAGGAGVLAERALALLQAQAPGGDDPAVSLRLAGHLAELAALAAPIGPGCPQGARRGVRPAVARRPPRPWRKACSAGRRGTPRGGPESPVEAPLSTTTRGSPVG